MSGPNWGSVIEWEIPEEQLDLPFNPLTMKNKEDYIKKFYPDAPFIVKPLVVCGLIEKCDQRNYFQSWS